MWCGPQLLSYQTPTLPKSMRAQVAQACAATAAATTAVTQLLFPSGSTASDDASAAPIYLE